MKIYIPTYRRDRVITYENLSPTLQKDCCIVLDNQDYTSLKVVYPEAEFWITSKQGQGAATIKQVILDQSKSLHPVCCMFDDDLVFNYGTFVDDKKRFSKATPNQIHRGITETYNKCLSSPDIGFTFLGCHFFNDTRERWIKNRKGCYALFINNTSVTKSGARFTGETMSDVTFMMELATRGYGSYAHSYLVVDDVSRSATGGEGAIPSRGKRADRAMDLLIKRWPEYITPRRVPDNKRHFKNMGTIREITVYFSRAVKDARKALERV